MTDGVSLCLFDSPQHDLELKVRCVLCLCSVSGMVQVQYTHSIQLEVVGGSGLEF